MSEPYDWPKNAVSPDQWDGSLVKFGSAWIDPSVIVAVRASGGIPLGDGEFYGLTIDVYLAGVDTPLKADVGTPTDASNYCDWLGSLASEARRRATHRAGSPDS